jgi:hypothetical protein
MNASPRDPRQENAPTMPDLKVLEAAWAEWLVR